MEDVMHTMNCHRKFFRLQVQDAFDPH